MSVTVTMTQMTKKIKPTISHKETSAVGLCTSQQDSQNLQITSMVRCSTTETKSIYIMIESTLSCDDIGVVPGLLRLYLFRSKVKYVATKSELGVLGDKASLFPCFSYFPVLIMHLVTRGDILFWKSDQIDDIVATILLTSLLVLTCRWLQSCPPHPS